MQALITAYSYTHDKGQGFIVVGIVCGLMIIYALGVAYYNFGPPAKHRAEKQAQQ